MALKSAWSGIKTLTGMKKSNFLPDVTNAESFCNELNTFYARFDKYNFSPARKTIVTFLRNMESDPIDISEEVVLESLKSVKAGKAAGPDRIGSSVIKLCREPLTPILRKIYQRSINDSHIPRIWKTSEIIPVPKKIPPKCLNDYRPIALTAILMKCLERLIKSVIEKQVQAHVDKYQFAYTAKRCVEDATLSMTDFVLKHVDKVNTSKRKHFAKILYVDFSSAFNTIQPHIMMQKLINMGVNSSLILWINEFLTDRLQYVKYQNTQSEILSTNTGAPQGCVLSPILFTLYTSDCRCINENCQLFKYADDTALVSQCVNDDREYRQDVQMFVDWCSNNYLEINVKKTKEMLIDFSVSKAVHSPLYINNELVETVKEYKYLGTIIDCNFNFNENTNSVFKKVNARLYFARKLHKLRVDKNILELFYVSIIQSVLSFSIVCWFGNCSAESKGRLTRVIKTCNKLGVNTTSLEDLYKKSAILRCGIILKDDTHPLNRSYNLLPSGKRYRSAKSRTARYSNSFVPSSIRLINDPREASLFL